MTISLIINNKTIDQREVDIFDYTLISQREKVVVEYARELKNQYARDIALAGEWKIEASAPSKANKINHG